MENLKVTVKDGKPCEKVLTIEVPSAIVQKEFDHFYQAVAPQAKVPGFRPGKAPRHVLEMHYKQEAHDRVLQNLISDSFKQVLKEQSLEPLGYPRVEDVNFKDNRLSFKSTIEVRPKIKLSRVRGLSTKKEKVEVKSEELDQELKHVQDSLAQFKVVEDRASQMGDYLIADYVCLADGKEIDKRTDDWLELRENEFLKGFSAQLTGMKPGEEREISAAFPENMPRKELAGKTAQFKVKVKEVKQKILPPLSDELAKEAGEYKSLDELKDKISKDLMAAKEKQFDVAFENALLDELVKHNKIDLPEGLVRKRFERLMEDAKQRFQQQGASEADFENGKGKLTADLEAEAKRQIHIAFLLDEIATQENITVTDEDKKQKYRQTAERIRQPNERIEQFYGENEDARDALIDQIRNEKAIQFLKENVKFKH